MTRVEMDMLFGPRVCEDDGFTEKQEALYRFELLFADHNEPLLLTVLEPVHDSKLFVTA